MRKKARGHNKQKSWVAKKEVVSVLIAVVRGHAADWDHHWCVGPQEIRSMKYGQKRKGKGNGFRSDHFMPQTPERVGPESAKWDNVGF